jgi:hypothetical protein
MRFGQQGTLTRIWSKTGVTPKAAVQTEYDWVYIFGAACPLTGATAGLVMPYVNIEAMDKHLAAIGEMAGAAHVLLLMDQAGWHVSKKLTVPENITIANLPPYSPELNPIELMWKYLREHCFSNRVYKDYNELLDAGCNAWNYLVENVSLVKSLCHIDWTECVKTY